MNLITLASLVFEATRTCNQKCLHCYNVWKAPGTAAGEDAGYRTAVRTLRALFRQARVGRISMSGGEPLLAERFTELVLLCRMRGAAVSVITSGTVGDADIFSQLLRLGVDLFEIPVNCDQSTPHDAMAGMTGSWHRAVRTLRVLLDRGASVVCVIVLTRLNAARIVQTLEFLAASGVRRVMLNRFNLGGSGIQERSGLLLAAAELRDAYRAADQAASRLSLSVSANVGTPWCIIDPRHYPHITMSSCGRVPEGMPLTLGADGSLRLCNHSPVILGNIHRNRIDVLLKDKTASAFLSGTPTLCVTCGLYEDCRGGCRAASQQLGIPLESHDPISSTVSAAAI